MMVKNSLQNLFLEYRSELKTASKLFFWGVIFGGLYGFLVIKTPKGFIDLITPIFEDITSQVSPENPQFLPLFLALFKRNLGATMLMVFLGLIHRFLPLGIIFFNGGLIGIVIAFLVVVGRLTDLMMLIPHGIFELPALFLATAMGISVTTKSENKGINARYKTLLKYRKTLLYITGLLVIAGAIEAGSIVLSKP